MTTPRVEESTGRLAQINAVLEALDEVWKQHPSLRLGQLIASAIAPSYRSDPFYIPDAEMLQSLRIFGESHVR